MAQLKGLAIRRALNIPSGVLPLSGQRGQPHGDPKHLALTDTNSDGVAIKGLSIRGSVWELSTRTAIRTLHSVVTAGSYANHGFSNEAT